MRTFVTAALFLSLGLIHPVSLSFYALSDDFEGSGHELEGSGSGSGDGSEHDEKTNMITYSKVKVIAKTPWPPVDFKSDFVDVGNSKNYLENEDIISGIIAGAVTGVVLAALLAAILIYKWQKKKNGGYIPGQQVHRDKIII